MNDEWMMEEGEGEVRQGPCSHGARSLVERDSEHRGGWMGGWLGGWMDGWIKVKKWGQGLEAIGGVAGQLKIWKENSIHCG